MATVHPPAPELKIPSEYAGRLLLVTMNTSTPPTGTAPEDLDHAQAVMYIKSHCLSKLIHCRPAIDAFIGKMYMDGLEAPNPDMERMYAHIVATYERPMEDAAYAKAVLTGLTDIADMKYGNTYPAHVRHHLAVLSNPESTEEARKQSRASLEVLLICTITPLRRENALGAIKTMASAESADLGQGDPTFQVPILLHDPVFAEAFRRLVVYMNGLSESPDEGLFDLLRKMHLPNQGSSSDGGRPVPPDCRPQ